VRKSSEADQIAEALAFYLGQNPESSAKRISGDLEIDKTIINSTLYSNLERFVAIGERPPLWSLKEPESQEDPALIENLEKLLAQISLGQIPLQREFVPRKQGGRLLPLPQ